MEVIFLCQLSNKEKTKEWWKEAIRIAETEGDTSKQNILKHFYALCGKESK